MTTRLERGLRIYLLLQEGASYDAYQLAEMLGVTRRTVFRDIALLKEMGLPVEFDKGLAAYTLSDASAGTEGSADTNAPTTDSDLAKGSLVPQSLPGDEQVNESLRKVWLVADPGSLSMIGQAIRERQTIRLRRNETVSGDSGEPTVTALPTGSHDVPGSADASEGITVLPIELHCTRTEWTLKHYPIARTSAAPPDGEVSESPEVMYVVDHLPHSGSPPPAGPASLPSPRPPRTTNRPT